MSAKSDKRAALTTVLTAKEGDGSNLTQTQADAINGLQAEVTAEADSGFDADDSRLPNQSIGDGVPYGLRTADANTGPGITSALTKSGTQGSAISTYSITSGGTPTSYSASGLPTGLSLNTSTGAITGTPTVRGTFTARIGATDASGTTYKNLVFTIASGASVITSALTASGTHSVAFTYTATASGAAAGKTFTASGLPSGLSINASTGVISGTLGAGTAGVANVSLTCTNDYGADTQDLVITID